MADQDAHNLMSLPLEVRHKIFAHTAACDVKPKNLLRHWFEKQDLKQQLAVLAANDPAGPAPQIVYNADSYEEDSEVSDEDEDEEADDVEDSEGDDDEAEGDSDHDEAEHDDEDDEAMDDEETGGHATAAPVVASASAQIQTSVLPPAAAPVSPVPGTVGASTVYQIDQQVEMDDDEESEDAEEQEDEMVDIEDIQEGEVEIEDDDGEDVMATTSRTIVYVHSKWRHIPNFMRLTQCPPPVELLLGSQQLNAEAKDWYYDVAVLKIEATASFAHTSFVEEAFSQITEAAFSPMENIRKVEVTFVWDSTWIRADTTGFVEAIFPALLRQRADFVVKILQQAPDLREVTVHWHDSSQDPDSTNLRVDIYEGFLCLRANVKFEEHYITEDATPNRKSIVGRRRVEFQKIVDNGLDRPF